MFHFFPDWAHPWEILFACGIYLVSEKLLFFRSQKLRSKNGARHERAKEFLSSGLTRRFEAGILHSIRRVIHFKREVIGIRSLFKGIALHDFCIVSSNVLPHAVTQIIRWISWWDLQFLVVVNVLQPTIAKLALLSLQVQDSQSFAQWHYEVFEYSSFIPHLLVFHASVLPLS